MATTVATEKGMTLWEIVKENLGHKEIEVPPELKVFNPYQAKVGDFFTIKKSGLLDKNFSVIHIRVYQRQIGNETFNFVDYVLDDSDGTLITVRVNPIIDPNAYDKQEYAILLLSLDCETEYNEDLHKNVLPSGELEVKDEKDKVVGIYNRLNDLKTPFEAQVTVFNKGDESRVKSNSEGLLYWDFARETESKSTEYYFVEMDDETGWMIMLKGEEIPEADVVVIRKKVN